MKVICRNPRILCGRRSRDRNRGTRTEKYGPPVYVRHEIVPNGHVVQSLKAKGARFVAYLDEIPQGARMIFSAHGVTRSVEDGAAALGLPVLDTTCPLVSKAHSQGERYVQQESSIVLIGHASRPEVEGTKTVRTQQGCAKSAPKQTSKPTSSRMRVNSTVKCCERRKSPALRRTLPHWEFLSSCFGPIELTTLPGIAEDIKFKLPAELN